jgi:hypothetical protein
MTPGQLRRRPRAARRIADDQRVERADHRRGFHVCLAADADQGEGDGGSAQGAEGGAHSMAAGIDSVAAKNVGEDVGAELRGQGEEACIRVVSGPGGVLVKRKEKSGRGDLHWEEVVWRVDQRDETVGEELNSVRLRHCCGVVWWGV